MRRSDLERFWSRVDQSAGSDGCWIWTGEKHQHGYGEIRWYGRKLLTHRVAYELVNGPIPQGMSICHTCDNPPCCNPNHLWLGTAKDNAMDREYKGRGNHTAHSGEFNSQAKLTQEKVRVIRARFRDGVTLTSLANEYGVAITTISAAVRGRTWKE